MKLIDAIHLDKVYCLRDFLLNEVKDYANNVLVVEICVCEVDVMWKNRGEEHFSYTE
jgi:hypothetical protein